MFLHFLKTMFATVVLVAPAFIFCLALFGFMSNELNPGQSDGRGDGFGELGVILFVNPIAGFVLFVGFIVTIFVEVALFKWWRRVLFS